MTERKKHRLDRKDAYYVGGLDSMHTLMPFMLPGRTANEAVMNELVDLTAIEEFLAKKNAGEPEFKYTFSTLSSPRAQRSACSARSSTTFTAAEGFMSAKI